MLSPLPFLFGLSLVAFAITCVLAAYARRHASPEARRVCRQHGLTPLVICALLLVAYEVHPWILHADRSNGPQLWFALVLLVVPVVTLLDVVLVQLARRRTFGQLDTVYACLAAAVLFCLLFALSVALNLIRPLTVFGTSMAHPDWLIVILGIVVGILLHLPLWLHLHRLKTP